MALVAALSVGAAQACDLCAISSSVQSCPLAARARAEAAAAAQASADDAADGAMGGSSAGSPGPDADTESPLPALASAATAWYAGISVGALAALRSERDPIAGRAEVVDPAGQYIDSDEVDLALAWRFSDRFGVRAYVPWIYRDWHRVIGTGTETRWLAGVGDIPVEGTWTAWRHAGPLSSAVLTVFAGVRLPTGDDTQLGQHVTIGSASTSEPVGGSGGHNHGAPASAAVSAATGIPVGARPLVHGHDIALGSGALAGIGGFSFFVAGGGVFGTAHGEYMASATNGDGYRMGDALLWGGGPGLYLAQGAFGRLGVQANCAGEWHRVDRQDGTTVPDTGRLEVFLGPDLTFTRSGGLSAELGLDLPVIRRAEGEQLLARWQAHAGVSLAW